MKILKNKDQRHDGSIIQSIDPATLDVLDEVRTTPAKDVESIVDRERDAFPAWRDLGLRRRVSILRTAQQRLLDRADEFARMITMEMGRPLVESMTLEIMAAVDLMGYYTHLADDFLGEKKVSIHNLLLKRRQNHFYHQPLGVLGIISPWNWPLLIPLGCIIPALLAGNCVIHKHSEITPLISGMIEKLFLDAGVPADVFSIIQGYGSVGRALVHSSVEKIYFTGSTEVGRMVMEQAAPSLKKVVLELGGNDPAIVCEDADLEMASSGIVWGRYSNCGQNCNAVERVYVHERIAERFINLTMEKAKKIRIGPGLDPNTDMGPLASAPQRKKIEQMAQQGVDRGAKLVLGGHPIENGPGYFYPPSILVWNRSIDHPRNEEVFGPLLNVIPVHSDDEAVQWANDSCFGLSASVWTTDLERGKRISHRIEAGSVMVNDAVIAFGINEFDWTGIKKSGVGWVHGEKGLDEMVNIQSVCVNPQYRCQNFWWFPYSTRMLKTMSSALKFLFARNFIQRLKALPRVLGGFTGYLVKNRRRPDKL